MGIKAVVDKNVRTYPELKGFSHEELAFEAGLHRTYVSGVGRGIRYPTVLIVAKLAEALGVSPSKILEIKE